MNVEGESVTGPNLFFTHEEPSALGEPSVYQWLLLISEAYIRYIRSSHGVCFQSVEPRYCPPIGQLRIEPGVPNLGRISERFKLKTSTGLGDNIPS